MTTRDIELGVQRKQSRVFIERISQPGERESNRATWVGLALAVLVIVAAGVMR